MMNIVVKKFGGSSVENKEKLEKVCKKIIRGVKKQEDVVVVVSAQGKTTDELINKAEEYVGKADLKTMDMLLSTGEIQTASLLTMMLIKKGYDAVSMTGMQAGIVTDSNYSKAKILTIIKDNIISNLKENRIVVVAGFQGVDKLGNITTLGRGGSDLTAVALAASLNANKCEIYTDVDGIFAGNPKVIKEVKKIKEVSYDTMIEAAVAGSKVMHNRAIGVGKRYNIPIEVKNTMNNRNGSIISDKKEYIENYSPKIIASKTNLAKITIVGEGFLTEPKYVERVNKVLKEKGLPIESLSVTEKSLAIVTENRDLDYIINRLYFEIIDKK